MKRILSIVLVVVILAASLFALVSCGKTISGTYADALNLTSYEFKGNKVAITIDNIIGEDTVIEGKYEINKNEEDKYEITFTFEGDETEEYSGTFAFAEGEENGKDYIKIGPVKYTKK